MPSDASGPQLIYAAFLYAARRYSEAEIVLLEAVRDYGGMWQANILLVCIFIAQDQPDAPLQKPDMGFHQTLPDGTAVYTGIVSLLQLWRIDPSHPASKRPWLIHPNLPHYVLMKSILRLWVRAKLAAWTSIPENAYLKSIADAPVCPFHLALGYLALGNHDKAVKFLRIDFDRGHPLMAWLHLWPIFDPLRNMPEFQGLLARMNLPQV